MSHPIVEKIDEIGTLMADYRKTNDQRLEELRKGNTTRADELEQKLTRMDTVLNTREQERKRLEVTVAALNERLELAEAAMDRPKGSPQERLESEYKSAFLANLRTGFQNPELSAKMRSLTEKQREFKDVTVGTLIGGGYGVPKEIATEIEKLVLLLSEIVANVKNVQVGTSDYQELVSIWGGTSGWVAETASRTATGTPNLRNVKPTWGELYAYPQISEWSIQDIQFDVANWLTQDVADGMAVALSKSIWSGNGTAQPTGMTNTSPVTTADYASPMRAAAAYQYVGLKNFSPSSPLRLNMDGILNLIYSVRPPYRQGAKFAISSAVQGAVRRLKSTYGVYYWEPSLQMGQPDRLVGYPVFTWEDMGSNAAGQNAIAFGNFMRAYLLVSRTEMMITQDQVTNPGYIRFYVRRRYGGMPLNNDAVKFLQVTDSV